MCTSVILTDAFPCKAVRLLNYLLASGYNISQVVKVHAQLAADLNSGTGRRPRSFGQRCRLLKGSRDNP